MPRVKLIRKAGPIGVALTAWDIWHRLPPRQRRWLLQQARVHGPRLARQAVVVEMARRKRKRKP